MQLPAGLNDMNATACRPEYTERAQEFWRQNQQTHDVSTIRGKVAATDPENGRVWIADSGVEVARQVRADGVQTAVWLVTVGYNYYVRKGRSTRALNLKMLPSPAPP